MLAPFEPANRRTVRGPINPMDKTTIVSIFPNVLKQEYVTVDPPQYIIPSGSIDKPGILVVGSASTWMDMDPERPLIEVPISSPVIAQAILENCPGSVYGADPSRGPGMFFIPGEKTQADVLKNYKNELDKALGRQRSWYNYLINQADSLWARANGNPLALNDDMRLAARELNQLDKDWLKNFQNVEKVRCKACGSFKDPQYPICSVCRHGDTEAVKKLGLVAVGV